jgi:hypothetical protein
MTPMKWLTLSLLALASAGCSTPSNEVVKFADGRLRAPTYVEAGDYCKAQGTTARMLGRAPGETGVMFRCN